MNIKISAFLKFFPALLLLIIFSSCKETYEEPTINLDGYQVEEGFSLEVVASEPLLEAPVQIDFDTKGRIWVAEMTGFMRDVDGTDENQPSGSIKILEDRDRDGVMDHAKVFLDSLVMPRALTLVYGGLLYAVPPNLYFVEIGEDDRPKNRVVVDSLYALEGNPEYQPNGLRLNIDNWIYNAGSHFRYQRKNGEWKKEPTTYRGQWGITHDNFGRLYYNNNSTQLLGDYVLPNRLVRNQHLIPNKGVNQKLTEDQRVYPIHAARVNRGYVDGVLDKDSLLREVTAACAPLVYRGGQFSDKYDQNVFVCIPEINAVKRNILTFKDDKVEAQQAWEGKEFLASTDEGFRPVNLSNGPDGNMYVVDMHRGVIQHHAFLSPYLKKRAKEAKLDTLVDFGRILRVKSKFAETIETPDFDKLSAKDLVQLLRHKNGYIRDQAQHRLVYMDKTEAIPELLEMAQNTNRPTGQIHALNTLNGIGKGLSFELLSDIARVSDAEVVNHTIVLLENYISKENSVLARDLFEELIEKNEKSIDVYIASTLGVWLNTSHESFYHLVNTLRNNHGDNPVIMEALLGGLVTADKSLLASGEMEQQNDIFHEEVLKNIGRKDEDKKNPIYVSKGSNQDSRTKGAKLYRQICASCHQANGTGVEGLAPPLVGSEHILPPEKLSMIVLHGLKGPIEVDGTMYDLNHSMPGLNSNETLSDKDISAIVSYVTNAFSKYPKGLSAKKVRELREMKSKSGSEYTIEELEEKLKTLK
ncbi:mono/diheme cytochrome c family protein [Flavobacteriaceae bacterium MAR_2009_75]|nr:mono/diheme cytochrome c family protein [Flavobacteriaceae bacterium MAR_2009_75]